MSGNIQIHTVNNFMHTSIQVSALWSVILNFKKTSGEVTILRVFFPKETSYICFYKSLRLPNFCKSLPFKISAVCFFIGVTKESDSMLSEKFRTTRFCMQQLKLKKTKWGRPAITGIFSTFIFFWRKFSKKIKRFFSKSTPSPSYVLIFPTLKVFRLFAEKTGTAKVEKTF